MLKLDLACVTLVSLPLGLHTAIPQIRKSPSPPIRITKETGSVYCYDKEFSSKTVRSPSLSSQDGKYRAYVEVSAYGVPSSKKGEEDWPVCMNRSRLFVTGLGETDSSIAFEKWAQPRYGNGLKLVDWSADSRYLIGEWSEWKYETDSSATYVFIYDVVSKRTTITNAYLAFNKFFSSTCGPIIEIVAFRESDGRIVIKASPDEMMEDDCIQKDGYWLFDQWNNWVSPMRNRPVLKKNSRWEEPN